VTAELLWLLPALPFLGAAVLGLAASRLPRAAVSVIGPGSVGLSAVITAILAARFLGSPPAGGATTQVVWTWLSSGGLSPRVAFTLDALSLVMISVITGVGFLIHLYSTEYMGDDESYARFFACMNLFVGAMLVLVLADNLLLLYLGWEGVGLCSYLLIGFWYRDSANGYAARKAFVVTRIGDTAMAIGIFLIVMHLGTLDIPQVLERASAEWAPGGTLAVTVALLLLGGAVGKSAQLPLQTWLPDAMAGPTPVSALIHAATMVTAGVYLIARMHTLFTLAPPAMTAVAAIGAATLLIAGCSALVQRDIKRVLAYSTISQLGYMFLALGLGAFSAAVFHLMTHAFFKALLFLGAGAVILALHHEQDMGRMGGLKRELPVVFWTFLAGSAALAGLPLVTAGFFSKDLILWRAWSSPDGGRILWLAGIVGALLTAIYIFRLVFLVFFGPEKTPVHSGPESPAPPHPPAIPGHHLTWKVHLPLIVLAVLSIAGGWVELPPLLGDQPRFSRFLDPVFERAIDRAHGEEPAAEHGASTGEVEHTGASHDTGDEILTMAVAIAASLGGIALAWMMFGRASTSAAEDRAARVPGVPAGLAGFWLRGWDFDRLYDALFVRPFVVLAILNRGDVVDLLPRSIAAVVRGGNAVIRRSQTGRLRWYAAGIAAGAILVLALVFYA
jgi:NADH-quinone oxidoreductase subunit L